MQHIFEYSVNGTALETIHKTIKKNKIPFEPSDVYSTSANEKTIRTDLRLSEKRIYNDETLFQVGKQILDEINQKITGKKFIIYKNNITYIKYNEGGFFKSHEDYLSVTSNLVEEYSMILCINGKCDGGETILQFNELFSYKCEKTKISGGCLLFRKDIPHEGALVKNGTKEILTYNVWCIKNQDDQILVINFENDDRKCLLSKNVIINYPFDNIFKRFLMEIPKDDITQYTSTHTFDQFQIIMKIYNGSSISNDEYNQYIDVIKYYNFDITHIFVKSFQSPPITKKSKYVDKDLILFGNETQYVDFFNDVKKNKIQCVPFKIIFAEGLVGYGGGMSGTPSVAIKWRPVWASFSDYNHVMLIHNICSKFIDLSNNYYEVNGDMITKKP